MFCTNCGSEVKDGAKFCKNCGAPLGGRAPVPVNAPTPAPETAPSGAATAQAGPQAGGKTAPRGFLIASVAALVLSLCAFGFFVLGGGKGALAKEVAVSLPVSVQSLDEGGTRIPISVVAIGADGEKGEAQTAYINSEGKGLSLRPGIYEVGVQASPIASDGTLYLVPTEVVTLVVPSGELTDQQQEFVDSGAILMEDDSYDEVLFELEPLDPADVSDEILSMAKELAMADAELGDVDPELLASLAEEMRDEAIAEREAEEEARKAEEEAQRKAEEEAKRKAEEEARYTYDLASFAFVMPEGWRDGVSASSVSDGLSLTSTTYTTNQGYPLGVSSVSEKSPDDQFVQMLMRSYEYGGESFTTSEGYTAYICTYDDGAMYAVVKGPSGRDALINVRDTDAARALFGEMPGYGDNLDSILAVQRMLVGVPSDADGHTTAVAALKVLADGVRFR